MDVSEEPRLEPDDWGGDDGVISPDCTVVEDCGGAKVGDSCPPSLLETQVSVIPGTDASLLHMLDTGAPEWKRVGASKKRRLSPVHGTPGAPSFSGASQLTYAGFRDPDFFFSSGYTPSSPKRVDASCPPPVTFQKPVVPSSASTNSKVIIIEPVADHRAVDKFFSDDVALARGLKNSSFHPFLVDSRKNFARKLLILTVSKAPPEALGGLLETCTLGDWSVVCRLPLMHTSVRGVIGPLGLDSNLVELRELLIEDNPNVSDIKRLCQGKDKVPTLSVIVSFSTTTLPESVSIYHQRFRVRPFVDKPWQCYRCQHFGHSADQCRYKPRCLVCSGPHVLKDCPQRGSPAIDADNPSVRCANCKGNHTAHVI